MMVGRDCPGGGDLADVAWQVGHFGSDLGDPMQPATLGAVLAEHAHDVPIAARLHGGEPLPLALEERGLDPLRRKVVHHLRIEHGVLAERGQGATLNGRPLRVSSIAELQKSLLVTGFPYDAWNTEHDNFANFEKLGKLTQGVRRLGSAAIDLCYVASGRFEGFWELALKPWDVAAGALICEEAGARVTNVLGGPDYISSPQSVVATAPGIHARMLAELHRK